MRTYSLIAVLVACLSTGACQRNPKEEVVVPKPTEEQERFLEAVGAGDLKQVGETLADIDLTSEVPFHGALGPTALLRTRNLEVIRLLLNAGVSPNDLGDDKNLLMQAASEGNVEVVRLLLDEGVDLSSKGALWAGSWSSSSESLDVLKLLVERGLDVNAKKDEEFRPPLLSAAAAGETELVRFLLEVGADPTLETIRRNKDGTVDVLTPISEARKPEIRELLLEAHLDS